MTSDSSARSDPQQQIIDRASTDPDFRNRLLANPSAAASEQLEVPIPPNVTIRVVEEQPGEVVLVLPSVAPHSGARLSDEDLEKVAGGLETWYVYSCEGSGCQ
jgi:hypothetical protein